MSDPIADMLTRLRNANNALLTDVEVYHSKLKESIAGILKREGYLADYSVEGTGVKKIKMKLKFNGRKGVIAGLKKPISSISASVPACIARIASLRRSTPSTTRM